MRLFVSRAPGNAVKNWTQSADFEYNDKKKQTNKQTNKQKILLSCSHYYFQLGQKSYLPDSLAELFTAILLATSLADEDDVDMAANTVTIRGNDTSVRIEGNTGTIRAVHHEKDDDDEDDDDDEGEMEDFSDDNEGVLTFQIDSLQEIDSAGNPVGLTGPSKKKHGVSSLVSQIEKYTFTQLDNSSTYQGIPVKNVNLSVHLTGPNASVDLQVMLFLRDGNVTFGNETFSVKSGTFKFNIKVRLVFSMAMIRHNFHLCGLRSQYHIKVGFGAQNTSNAILCSARPEMG